jgi:hypothetical protein
VAFTELITQPTLDDKIPDEAPVLDHLAGDSGVSRTVALDVADGDLTRR